MSGVLNWGIGCCLRWAGWLYLLVVFAGGAVVQMVIAAGGVVAEIMEVELNSYC